MGMRTIGVALVCAVMLLTVGLTIAPLSNVGGVQAQESISPETCTVCHSGAGDQHQAFYDGLYQDGVIEVTDMAYSFTAPNTTVVTFEMTKNGAPFNANDADSLSIMFVPYTGDAFVGTAGQEEGRLSLKGKITCDPATGVCTSTLVGDAPDVSNTSGLVVVYGTDEVVGRLPARIRQGKFPFAALLETGSGVNYVSAANNAGCEKCHTDPYLKHGYIYAQVNGDPSNDFYTCKACHFDDGEGGHFEWQLLVDNPELAAEFLAGEVELTPEQEAQYAYKTSVMNDVHMSHAMEFPYPQSMANCVTCHEGKLDMVLSDENFNVETCKSCHPVTGAKAPAAAGEDPAWDTTGLALMTVVPQDIHGSMDLNTTDCALCHGSGKAAAAFSEIHTGYDQLIYTADGQKYSDAIKVFIDSASLSGNLLTFTVRASENPDLAGIDVASMSPTVMVGLYGWETKDYIVGPHERLNDDNGDGVINRSDMRALEYVVGSWHPRFSTVWAAPGMWQVTANLANWADMIGDSVVRAEIAVLPALKNSAGVTIAVDAPSRTFNLVKNAFDDEFYGPIVEADKCDTCHEALATTFHNPYYGSGNVVVCRMCHVKTSGGSHLEVQSRSIDSYVHAVHSFQAFDVGDVDFTDPVQALEYEHHIEFPYPMHGIRNCESCHVEGTYNVPDQTKSLPAILSRTDTVQGWDRDLGSLPSYITGPASTACGGCHRAVPIKEDEPGELIPLLEHTGQFGYLIEAGTNARDTLVQVTNAVMALFR